MVPRWRRRCVLAAVIYSEIADLALAVMRCAVKTLL